MYSSTLSWKSSLSRKWCSAASIFSGSSKFKRSLKREQLTMSVGKNLLSHCQQWMAQQPTQRPASSTQNPSQHSVKRGWFSKWWMAVEKMSRVCLYRLCHSEELEKTAIILIWCFLITADEQPFRVFSCVCARECTYLWKPEDDIGSPGTSYRKLWAGSSGRSASIFNHQIISLALNNHS